MPTDVHQKVTQPTPQEVRREIERAREQLAQSAVALREEMAYRTDWRAWVQRRPLLLVTGAFAVGLMLGIRKAGQHRR
jgi:hypothetical protein